MIRYWIEFRAVKGTRLPILALRGVGVTASNEEDAMAQIRSAVFGNAELPAIATLIEDVDISVLDANHVRPNMGNPLIRGIWFPTGFQ